MRQVKHVIIGGGLAGTTIAVQLLERGEDFLLIESLPRLGGKIETKLTDEACYEFGPNSFTNQTEEIFQLLGQLHLEEDILEPSSAALNRYILKRGKIVCLPRKPPEILMTESLSLKGRLRLLREIFYVPNKQLEEESVLEFFARHFGREVAEYFADPFVSGIYAGDASRLSLKEAFPTMAEAELHSKSLIRYLIKQRKTAKATPQIYQLKRGLESMFLRASEAIGKERIHTSERVHEVREDGNVIKVVSERGEYQSEIVYLTTPAYVTAQFLKKGHSEISQVLEGIQYAPVVTVHLRIPKQETYPFDGFGILLPSIEQRKILGVLWNSSAFPSLFPDKQHHYLTVYVGGVRQTEIVRAGEKEIRDLVCHEVKELFSLKREPDFIQMRKHERAIPQYNLGYGKVLRNLRKLLSDHPSIKLAGNYWGGISIPRTVTSAMQVAESTK